MKALCMDLCIERAMVQPESGGFLLIKRHKLYIPKIDIWIRKKQA